jgi:hypothetical protein
MTVRGVSVACLTMVQPDVLNRASKKAGRSKTDYWRNRWQ